LVYFSERKQRIGLAAGQKSGPPTEGHAGELLRSRGISL
jgi:hypothetical protein